MLAELWARAGVSPLRRKLQDAEGSGRVAWLSSESLHKQREPRQQGRETEREWEGSGRERERAQAREGEWKKEERAGDIQRERERRGRSHVSPACCVSPPRPLHSAALPANRNADPQPRPPSQPISFQSSQSIPDSLYNAYPETKQHCPPAGVLGKSVSALKRHNLFNERRECVCNRHNIYNKHNRHNT